MAAVQRRAAVLGSPISHSLSPALHRAAYAALGLPWTYDAIEVDASGLPAFWSCLDQSWAGLSLTMPLKEAVIDLLDSVDELARAITSVNTVIPGEFGWHGTNTDVYGMVEALTESGLAGQPRKGLILGAGATARSGLAAMARLGVQSVALTARRMAAATELATVADVLGVPTTVIDWAAGEQGGDFQDVDVTISTVPGDAGRAWLTVAGQAGGALLDAAYHPWPTPLAAAWSGPVVASGRQMLLWQAVEQVRLMTGLEAPVDAMRAALPAW